MPQYPANGLFLEAETLTPPGRRPRSAKASAPPPVLLVMGLGLQLTAWPEPFVQGLLARGHTVIRFDNRDVGLSTQRPEWGRPNLLSAALRPVLGLAARVPYTLHDMAADAVGLLDAMALPKAHVVGISMGGMIGQLMAATYPDRVASFACLMSSSGARHLPGPTAAARRVMLNRPLYGGPQASIDHSVKVMRTIGSTRYPTPEARLRERAAIGVARAHHPMSTLRHMAAIAATGDRSRLLRDISSPTSVIHGHQDPLVPVAAAHDLAAKIPGAELCLIDGMGHDLPAELMPEILDAIDRTIARAAA